MGAEDKPGFLSSKLTTIILIGVLVILVIMFIWIQTSGGFSSFFEKFKKKREVKPALKPVMGQELRHHGERAGLELADNGFIIVTEAELS